MARGTRSTRKRTVVFGAALIGALGFVFLVLVGNDQVLRQGSAPTVRQLRGTGASTSPANEDEQGFLYGRVTTADGGTYQGRLRFGRDQEAFWGDYFNGSKAENPWVSHTPAGQTAGTRRPIEVFGFQLPLWNRRVATDRPFMARFGDLARVEARGLNYVRVTLKSGTVFDLNRNAASDFDDGVRVWDRRLGVVDLASWAGGIPPLSRVRLEAIEFLPTAALTSAPSRLHGTVRTRQGVFSGFVQWDRQDGVATDVLEGYTHNRALNVRYNTIRSIARQSADSSMITLLDGREVALSGTRDAGFDNRGVYVDDQRYGRVLISWAAFERIDFDTAGSGPAYDEFAPGRALGGSVTTRQGRRITGRLVYDLDESETTDTLDAPSNGVDYSIPFGLIASIRRGGQDARGARRATVTLYTGEALQLDPAGDLGDANGGVLIFINGLEHPEYVPWTDVEQIDLHQAAE